MTAAALAQLMQKYTTIVIAHRLATVLPCNRILWLDWGRIIEEDTHPTLANSGNLCVRLAKLQFKAARTEIVAPTGPLHQPPFRVRQLSMVGAKASRRCRKPALHAELAA